MVNMPSFQDDDENNNNNLDGKSLQDDDADGFSGAEFAARLKVEEKIPSQAAEALDEGFRPAEEAVLLLPDVEIALALEPVARLTAQVRQLLGVEAHVVGEKGGGGR